MPQLEFKSYRGGYRKSPSKNVWDWWVRDLKTNLIMASGEAKDKAHAERWIRGRVLALTMASGAYRANPARDTMLIGIFPDGHIRQVETTAEALTWRVGKRTGVDRGGNAFRRKYGQFPVAWTTWNEKRGLADIERWLRAELANSPGRDERRKNPSAGPMGYSGWLAPDGTRIHAGDTVEYWRRSGLPYGAKPVKTVRKVLKLLVFDDHVQVNYGSFGDTVDADNYIRRVSKRTEV